MECYQIISVFSISESFYKLKNLNRGLACLFFLTCSPFYIFADSFKEHNEQSHILTDVDESVSHRLHNIELMQHVLKKGQYNGYDIIVVSSTNLEEAQYQQKILEKAFEGTSKSDGSEPIILSVVDSSDGGQLIGSVYTWLMADKKMRAVFPKLMEGCSDLLDYVKKSGSKVAAFHNGGKGERSSPLTQSLGNSRGSQKLVGFVKNAKGDAIELEVLLGVILQCSSFALTNTGNHIDTFWTSQIAFGSHPHDKILRSNFALDKFLVGFDKKNLNPQNIADFGTASLSSKGRLMAFYGNKRFAMRKGSQYVIDKDKIERELFAKGEFVAYDFGSFCTSLDMWALFIDYWTTKSELKSVFAEGFSSKIKRDIDPHFIQPLIRLLFAINNIEQRQLIDDHLSSDLNLKDPATLKDAYETFAKILKESFPQAHFYLWEEIENEAEAKKRDEGFSTMQEAIEFYLSYRKTPVFNDLERVFGFIDLGTKTQWFRYRRPIDILNEKLEMLSDLISEKIEVQLNGEIIKEIADDVLQQRSIESRLMRGISENSIAQFTVEGKPISLNINQIKKGASIEGVYIKNSIVQNCDLTRGSLLINSIANHVIGKVIANESYLESSTAPLFEVNASIVHEAIDMKSITADREVVSDVYRTKISPPYHGRMRAPIGFDPKGMPIYKGVGNLRLLPQLEDLDGAIDYFVTRIPYSLKSAKFLSDETARTDDGLFTFDEIRKIMPIRIADKSFKETVNSIAKEVVSKKRDIQ